MGLRRQSHFLLKQIIHVNSLITLYKSNFLSVILWCQTRFLTIYIWKVARTLKSTHQRNLTNWSICFQQHRCFETREKLSHFFESAYIVASEAAWIDIANANVHKGTTVEHLQRLLDVTPEETMAFGDGYNDLELIVRAAYSFAVRNAVQELKDAANFITRSNEENGVMTTIIQMLSLQESRY